MKNKFLYIFIFATLFLTIKSFAQDKNWQLYFVPQQLFVNNIALEIELKNHPKKNQSFAVSPQIYLGKFGKNLIIGSLERNDFSEGTGKISGLGLFGSYKKFFGKQKNAYGSFGLGYRFLAIDFSELNWVKIQRNGFELQEFQLQEFDSNLSVFVFQTTIGFQEKVLKDKLILDYYAGLGFKAPFSNQNFTNFSGLTQYPWLPAYEGFLILLGVKFGFSF